MKQFIAKLQQAKIAQLGLCPLPTPLTPIHNGKILVFAPHPDDEILGCGGTLALLRQKGCSIKVIFVTDGSGAGSLEFPGKILVERAIPAPRQFRTGHGYWHHFDRHGSAWKPDVGGYPVPVRGLRVDRATGSEPAALAAVRGTASR